MNDGDLQRELDRARNTIAAQATRIYELEREGQSRSGVTELQAILQLADVAGATIGKAPYRSLLEGIVTAARRLFDASASSVALIDRSTNELVFEAAAGAGSEDILGMRFPAHQGIAGWIVMTGEAIAVADVRRDPRFSQGFAQSTGYVPTSIMAAPLLLGDEVEGVIEVLDKASAASFGLDDLELLGLFAHPAAVAVEQARLVSGVGILLLQELARLGREQAAAGGVPVDDDLTASIQAALDADSTTEAQTLELARLVHRLGRRGERSRRMVLEILGSVLRYTA